MEIKSRTTPAPPADNHRGGRRDDSDWLLPLVRQATDREIAAIELVPLKRGGVVAEVFRILPLDARGRPVLPNLVVKIIHAGDGKGGFSLDREVNFYAGVHPRLGETRPQVFFSGCRPETHERVVLMEDLAGSRTPPRTYRWTPAEAECFVRTYARFHRPVHLRLEDPVPWLISIGALVSGTGDGQASDSAGDPGAANGVATSLAIGPAAASAPNRSVNSDALSRAAPWPFTIRAWDFADREVLDLAAELSAAGAWGALPGLGDLLDWVLEAAPSIEGVSDSFLHGDVYPPNIALPADLSGEAVLIDWDMVGLGPAELDLAFMFLQPFGSADDLDRTTVLDRYWAERERLEGEIPPPAERARRQRFADALWGFYLIRVAHRSVFDPFAPGSSPDVYWQRMRGVLLHWLQRLCE